MVYNGDLSMYIFARQILYTSVLPCLSTVHTQATRHKRLANFYVIGSLE